MKWRIAVLIVLSIMVVHGVLAVGVQVPPDLQGTQTYYVHEPETINFTVKGDASAEDIFFFVDVSKGGGSLEVNNVQKYERSMHLVSYDTKNVQVEMEGVSEHRGTFEVSYGFRYNKGSGPMGMNQVIQSTFDARVYCSGKECETSDTSETTGAGAAGGGGGGGGGGYIPLEEEVNVTVPTASSTSESAVKDTKQTRQAADAVVSDVGGNSDIAQGSVNTQPSLPTTIGLGKTTTSKDGKIVLMAVFACSVLSLALVGVIRKAVKSMDEESG